MKLDDAKKLFFAELSMHKQSACPCCERVGRIYRRKLNSGMAIVLCRFYAAMVRTGKTWVALEDVFAGKAQDHRDWPLLRLWGLMEPQDKRTKEKNASGRWTVTTLGAQFVRDEVAVPRHIHLYDTKVLWVSDETTNIQQALTDKFSYAVLMRDLTRRTS